MKRGKDVSLKAIVNGSGGPLWLGLGERRGGVVRMSDAKRVVKWRYDRCERKVYDERRDVREGSEGDY